MVLSIIIFGQTLSDLPQFILKSFFFLPVGLLLCVALVYAIKSLTYLKQNADYQKQISYIIKTKSAINDYMSEAMYYLNITIGRIQAESDKYVKVSGLTSGSHQKLVSEYQSFKSASDDLLTSNQVSTAKSNNNSNQIMYSLPNPFGQKAVWMPVVISLGFVLLLNIIFYLQNVIHITPSSIFVTIGSLLFPIVITAMTYNYLCYSQSKNIINSQKLKQEQDLYLQRTKYLKVASQRISGHLQSLVAKEALLPQGADLVNYQQYLDTLHKITDGLIRVEQYSLINEQPPILDVSALTHRISKDFQPRVDNKKLKYEAKISKGVLTRVKPDEMRQLIGSLLENAIVFSEPNSDIELKLDRRFGKFFIVVSDSGAGISKDKLKSINKTFSISNQNNTDGSQIPGLNFMINRIIIAKLGGEYKISSAESVGTKVSLTFPIRRHAV